MNWWNNVETLNRGVFWLTVAMIAAPFVFGLLALVVQNRAKALEDQRLETLRMTNQSLAEDLQASKQQVAELERRTAPWRLSREQRERILSGLGSKPSSPVLVVCRLMDGESCDMAGDLASVLKAAGWTIIGPGANSLNSFFGVNVFSNSASGPLPGADRLLAAFTAAGLPCLSEPVPANSLGGPVADGTICIIVGRRPV